MIRVDVAEAGNQLTKLLKAVERGEQVTICRHGKPVANLVRAEGPRKDRVFGANRGGKILDPDWAKPQNDVEAWLQGDL